MKTKLLKSKKIHQICKKHPKWNALFQSWLEKNPELNTEILMTEFNIFLKYNELLKHDIYPDYFKDKNNNKNNVSNVEFFHDTIQSTLKKNKKRQFVKSIQSNKYRELFNDKVINIIDIMLDNNVSPDAIKHQFFNKLATYKESESLLSDLKEFKDKNITWTKEHYLKLINEQNLSAEIIDNQDDALMIHVKDYNACKTLGSQAWCIVKDEKYFEQYTHNRKFSKTYFNRQMIYMNFSKPIENNESMIGFTLNLKGNINESFLKNDDRTPLDIRNKFLFKQESNKIIENILGSLSLKNGFYFVCIEGLVNYVDKYLDNEQIDPNIDNRVAITYATTNKNTEIVKKILKSPKFNPTINNEDIISIPVRLGNIEIMKEFLKDSRIVEFIKKDSTAIQMSVNLLQEDAFNLLMSYPHPDLSKNNNELLKDSLEILEYEDEFSEKQKNITKRLLQDEKILKKINKKWALCYLGEDEYEIYLDYKSKNKKNLLSLSK